MTITLDYDNDQIRIEEAAPDATLTKVNGKTMDLIRDLLSEVLNRIEPTPLDISVRRQDDGELKTLEEW